MANSGLPALIELAYDAVLVPARWQAFLAALASQLGGASIGFSLRHPRASDPGWIVFHETDSAYEAAYCERFFDIDPFRLRSSTLAPGSCEMMAGGVIDASLLARSEFYNEWMRPQGWLPAPSLGVTLDRDQDGEPIGLGIFRPRGAREYGRRELGLLRALVPHLQRATRIARRLTTTEAQLAATTDALEMLPVAALLVDHAGRALRANRKALALADLGEAPAYAGGRLVLRPGVFAALRKLAGAHRTGSSLLGANATPAECVLVPRGDARSPLRLSAVPCSAQALDAQSRAGFLWVLIEDPDDVAHPSAATLGTHFGLTSAEARLCALLVRGHRLGEAAEELGVAQETVRTQLKSVFRKTGARSQADLIRLVLQRPALALGEDDGAG